MPADPRPARPRAAKGGKQNLRPSWAHNWTDKELEAEYQKLLKLGRNRTPEEEKKFKELYAWRKGREGHRRKDRG